MLGALLGGLGRSVLGGLGSSLFGGGSGGSSGGSGAGGLLGGLLGGGGGGGMFNPFSTIVSGLSQGLGPIGGAIGGLFGKNGAEIGKTLGSSLSNSLFGGNSSQTQQQPQQQFPSFGAQMGNTMGNMMNQGFNQYMPSSFQNQTFGNLGSTAGEYLGSQFGHPNFGKIVGGMADKFMSSYMPQDLRNQRMGDFGGYLGNHMGQQIDNGMQRYGMNPSYGYGQSSPNMGYGQSPSYGNIPEAPPVGQGFYDRAPGGGGGYRPPMQEPSYGMPSAQPGRGAMLADIRNYRRPEQNAYRGGNAGYGNVPEAPPMGQGFYDRAPGGNHAPRFSGQSGLRPTPPRSSQGFSDPMDLIRRSMGDRRAAIEPDEGDWEAPRVAPRSFSRPAISQRWGT